MGRPSPTLHDNVRAARQRARLSQQGLAHAIGLQGRNAGAYISRVEAGKQIPRLQKLIDIARATKTPLEKLIHGLLEA